MVLKQLDIHMQKMNLNTDLTPIMNINSKLVTDLNAECKTINLLEDNIWTLFIVAITSKEPSCPLVDEWLINCGKSRQGDIIQH